MRVPVLGSRHTSRGSRCVSEVESKRQEGQSPTVLGPGLGQVGPVQFELT